MRKEVMVTHEVLACDVCGRTILKGESTEPYLVQDGSRRLVCELCTRRAENAGWIREAAHADMPAMPAGAEPRPSLLERFRSRWRSNGPVRRSRPGRVEVDVDGREGGAPGVDWGTADPSPELRRAEEPRVAEEPHPPDERASSEGPLPPAAGKPHGGVEPHYPTGSYPSDVRDAGEERVVEGHYAPGARYAPEETYTPAESYSAGSAPDGPPLDEVQSAEASPDRGAGRFRRRLRDPRHVRAVPTNAEVKVERALELFNYSDYRRTVEGLVRTLGEPWVTAVPVLESTSEVILVVAWELSWYQYRVDLGDSDDPVILTHKGKELSELDVTLREWNAVADADGALTLGAARSQ
jgi:hypothetical protein